MMCPLRCARMPGSTAFVMAIRPNRLVSNIRRTSASSPSSTARAVAVASIVHQHIDGAEFRQRGFDGIGDLRRVRHIELQHERRRFMTLGEVRMVSGLRAVMTVLKPLAIAALAMSRPMPLEQPVMNHVGMNELQSRKWKPVFG